MINENSKQYKVVGTLNLFNVVPDFVYPIFESDGEYYFQNSSPECNIESFEKIPREKEQVIKMIHFLNEKTDTITNIKPYYQVGDQIISSFQIDKDTHFISDIYTFKKFITKYQTDNKILLKQIQEFFEEIAELPSQRSTKRRK